jgi:hypothetical protein
MTQETLLDSSNIETFDETKNYYSELVGEGKKFKDNESLAKGKYLADLHAQTLEKRLDELREDYLREREMNATRAKLEDVIKQLETTKLSNETPSNEVREPALKTTDIEEFLSKEVPKHVSAYELERRMKENFNTVKSKLIERFGNNYQNQYKDKIDQLGLTPERAEALAREAPTAFLTMLGLDRSPQRMTDTTPPSSSTSFRPQTGEKRKMSYYKELRKTKPMLYHDPKIAIEMEKMAQELGEDFFDVD